MVWKWKLTTPVGDKECAKESRFNESFCMQISDP